jgi:hypothetical protein
LDINIANTILLVVSFALDYYTTVLYVKAYAGRGNREHFQALFIIKQYYQPKTVVCILIDNKHHAWLTRANIQILVPKYEH